MEAATKLTRYQKWRLDHPESYEEHAKRMLTRYRDKRDDPEFRTTNAERSRAYRMKVSADPEWRERRRAYERERQAKKRLERELSLELSMALGDDDLAPI